MFQKILKNIVHNSKIKLLWLNKRLLPSDLIFIFLNRNIYKVIIFKTNMIIYSQNRIWKHILKCQNSDCFFLSLLFSPLPIWLIWTGSVHNFLSSFMNPITTKDKIELWKHRIYILFVVCGLVMIEKLTNCCHITRCSYKILHWTADLGQAVD